jgi:hypothetical protein
MISYDRQAPSLPSADRQAPSLPSALDHDPASGDHVAVPTGRVRNPRPFTWTKTAEEILNSLADYLAKLGMAQPKNR